MARHIEPVCRLCRREGEKLFLKGSRCVSSKCAIDRRPFFPGQHGPNVKARRNKASDFSVQLREKQKMRRVYGVLEKQFRRYFGMALKGSGVTGSKLIVLLERRLDNVIYRMGFAPSRAAARQIVAHAHLDVNGHPIDVPSYLVKPGDKITVREVSRKLPHFIHNDFVYDENEIQRIKKIAGGKKIVLSVGLLDKQTKQMDLLIDAVSKLPEPVLLVLLGEASAETTDLQQLLQQKMGSEGYIMQQVPHAQLGNWYRAADLFVLCSPQHPQDIQHRRRRHRHHCDHPRCQG